MTKVSDPIAIEQAHNTIKCGKGALLADLGIPAPNHKLLEMIQENHNSNGPSTLDDNDTVQYGYCSDTNGVLSQKNNDDVLGEMLLPFEE